MKRNLHFVLQIIVKYNLAFFLFLIISSKSFSQTFTNGNLTVFVAASGTANDTTASVIGVNTSSAGQAEISRAIPDGAFVGNGLRISGVASSTGYLSNSSDGSLLIFTGRNTNNTLVNVNILQNVKAVGTFNSTATYSLATTYTGTGTNQTRSTTTLNKSTYYNGH